MLIGECMKKKVTIDMKKSPNHHIGIIGESGTGKTTAMRYLAENIVECGGTVLFVDGTGDEIWDSLNSANVIDAKEGIRLPLLTPLVSSRGCEESRFEVIEKVVDAMSRQCHFGTAQADELKAALEWIGENGEYQKDGIRALDSALLMAGTRPAERVREMLSCITRNNIIVDGNFELATGKINRLDLRLMSERTIRIIQDLVISYVKRMAWSGMFALRPVYILVDELRNFVHGKNAFLPEIISEGRKYGLSVVWATQCFADIGDKNLCSRMMQAGSLLIFRPAENEVNILAKQIYSTNPGRYARIMRSLDIGSCLACGNFMWDETEVSYPIRVDIPAVSRHDVHTKSEDHECENQDGSITSVSCNVGLTRLELKEGRGLVVDTTHGK